MEDLGFDVVGKEANRVPNTTFVHIPNGGGIQVLVGLGARNIHVGLGSACGSGYRGASPLMKALGREGGPHDYIRISTFGEYTASDAREFLLAFEKEIKKFRRYD